MILFSGNYDSGTCCSCRHLSIKTVASTKKKLLLCISIRGATSKRYPSIVRDVSRKCCNYEYRNAYSIDTLYRLQGVQNGWKERVVTVVKQTIKQA
jgi:hypothetical protein